jgi:DNA-binding MarR family transcriptional regulator
MATRRALGVLDQDTAKSSAQHLLGASRWRLLVALFMGDASATHLRGLARSAGVALGLLQRELKKLEEVQLIRRTESGRTVTFQLNDQHPLAESMRQLLIASQGGLAKVASKRLEGLPAPVVLARFGERIDVLTIGQVDAILLGQACDEIEAALGVEVVLRCVGEATVSPRGVGLKSKGWVLIKGGVSALPGWVRPWLGI